MLRFRVFGRQKPAFKAVRVVWAMLVLARALAPQSSRALAWVQQLMLPGPAARPTLAAAGSLFVFHGPVQHTHVLKHAVDQAARWMAGTPAGPLGSEAAPARRAGTPGLGLHPSTTPGGGGGGGSGIPPHSGQGLRQLRGLGPGLALA